MKLWPFADFKPDFPDDGVEDDYEIVVLPGQNIAEAIREMLQRLGYVVTAPEHTPPYGWRFDARKHPYRIWFQVAHLGDEAVLGTEDRTPLPARLFGRGRRAHADLLTGLAEELARDPRFGDLTWWDRYDARGAPSKTPVI